MKDMKVYCDGSCIRNPGPGGWCSILIYLKNKKRNIKIIGGGSKSTTSNKMELQALIKGLSLLKNNCFIGVHSDSKHLINEMNFWKKRKTENKIKNLKIIKITNEYFWFKIKIFNKIHSILWNWIKSHNNNKFNSKADIEAKRQAILYLKNR